MSKKPTFEQATGWKLENRQACKGEVCIPLTFNPQEQLDLNQIASVMGLPLVAEPEHGLWAIGPEFVGAHALSSAECPGLVLPDLEGRDFHLSSLLGQKVLLYAWAPY